MATTHRTAYTLAALAFNDTDAGMDRVIKGDSMDDLHAARKHLFTMDRALTRAIAAIEMDAASTRLSEMPHV